jgi:UDP-N-acetylglucosamine enolpyruvyl transferase
MHTSLPEFKLKIKGAVIRQSPNKTIKIKGLENLKAAKMQSLRTGRIEESVEQIAAQKETVKVEVVVMPRIPETMHTVIVKGYDEQGNPTKAIMEVINIIHPTEEVELEGFEEIEDRRPTIGRH